MTVLVKMSNGDTEHFPAATHWAEILNGGLRVLIAAEPPVLVAEFPAGAWLAALDPDPKVPPPSLDTACGDPAITCSHGSGLGRNVHVHSTRRTA
jgi:hypothetical protein